MTKNLGRTSPPHLDKIQKNSYIFWETFPKIFCEVNLKAKWLIVTGLERDRAGLDLRGVGDRALVGLQDQGEGGGQIWVGGIELWVGVPPITCWQ